MSKVKSIPTIILIVLLFSQVSVCYISHIVEKNSTQLTQQTDSTEQTDYTAQTNSASIVEETNNNQPSKGSNTLVTILIILLVILILAAGGYGYYRCKQRQLIDRYSMHPEDGIQKQSLSFLQGQELNSWKFNSFPNSSKFSNKKCERCVVETQENLMGKQISVEFKQGTNIPSGIVSNHEIGKCNSSNIYYEVEIENLPTQSEIYVGFCLLDEFTPNQGITSDNTSGTSVVLNSSGQVFVRNRLKYDYKFKCTFGQTIGIGIRMTDGRVWLSYNGKFLNEPSRQEIMKVTKDDKLKQKLKEEEEQSNKTPEELQTIEKQCQMQVVLLDLKKVKQLHPVISSKGPCKLNINIGATPFRLYQKEIAKGLV